MRAARGLSIHLPTLMPPENPLSSGLSLFLYMLTPPPMFMNMLTPKSEPIWARPVRHAVISSNDMIILFITSMLNER